MATIPSPKTWASGNIPTASDFNTGIRDAVNFFCRPPRVNCVLGVQLTVPNQTWTLIPWDSEDGDTEGIHSTVTNTSRLVAVTAGRYEVKANLMWDWHTVNAGARLMAIRKNAAGSAGGGTCVAVDYRKATTYSATNPASNQSVTGYVFLNAGDYVEVLCWHDQQTLGSNVSSAIRIEDPGASGTANYCTHFSALWIGTV